MSQAKDLLLKGSVFILLFALLAACSPSSREDFREEGRSISRSLIKELHAIHSQRELLNRFATLKNLFERLTEVMIAARKFQMARPDNGPIFFTSEDRRISDLLRAELNRIYRQPGCRELLEKAQQQALDKLDRWSGTKHPQ